MAFNDEPFLPITLKGKDAGLMASLREPKRLTSTTRIISIHTGLIILYTIVSFVIIRAFTGISAPPLLDHCSPQTQVSASIVPNNDKLERKLYDNLNNNPFAGPPDPHIDVAWHGLLEGIHIRVTKEELVKSQQTSVLLPEGGGYLSWLGAYHELHCLKIIRRWTYRDHYYPNLTSEETGHHEMHSDHCIEYLRQAAMCHGDSSLAVFEWDQHKDKPMLSPKRSPHQCIDWDNLVDTVKSRAVSHDELAYLKNPLLARSDG